MRKINYACGYMIVISEYAQIIVVDSYQHIIVMQIVLMYRFDASIGLRITKIIALYADSQ